MKTFGILLLYFSVLCMMSCTNSTDNTSSDNSPQSSVQRLSYTITGVFPHDTSSFTQGLAFYKGQLLEGTGNEGKSKLMHVEIKTGKPVKEIPLENTYFGEGLTVINDTIYQLTWKNNIVLVYSAQDFKKIKEFPLNTDGWGLANDGKHLIVSDGSSNLYFYEPSTLRLLSTQSVTEDGSPVSNINELEYINGFIYANQWQYNYILKIDPNSGLVVAKLDLTELVSRIQAKIPGIDTGTVATLNGIAYDPQTNKIYVTGKYWPEMYEIQFEH
jgi:glutaminyl-peptide cyclotransferase